LDDLISHDIYFFSTDSNDLQVNKSINNFYSKPKKRMQTKKQQVLIYCIDSFDGSWIYNYMCNQCLSSQKLWVWILLMVRCT